MSDIIISVENLGKKYHIAHRQSGEGYTARVPVLLNTSLNENEPIDHTPKQAIDCFPSTMMDSIVQESLHLERLRR